MKQSIILKTLIILSIVIAGIFIGSAYLFSQNDNGLISDIRSYNLNSAMKALDERQQERLKLNKKQMKTVASAISKNSSVYLLNFDTDGLEQSLYYDMKKDGIKAIKIWDNAVREVFLAALKIDNKIVFKNSIPEEYKKFAKIKRPINIVADDSIERIGYATLYYDESLIINQINELKKNTKRDIENFNKEIDIQKGKSNTIKLYIAIGSFLTVLMLITILLMNFVNRPLKIIHSGLDSFFLFLQNKKTNTEKIKLDSNDEFGQMAKSLNENIEVSTKLHEEIHELNTNLEKKVEEKTQSITDLLDNADQGFLSFGINLIVDEEYSLICKKIFNKDISGKDIVELLYPNNDYKKEFFAQTLKSLLKESNKLKIKTIISLLQSEFIINKKAIKVKYKIIDSNKFMLILTDITAKKLLEKKIKKERNILKMIVAVVRDSENFFEIINDFEKFLNNESDLIDTSKTPLYNATELYREIHTYKGLFSQYEMSQIVSQLHKIESSFSDSILNKACNNKDLQTILNESDLSNWLQKDIVIIEDILGDELFNQKGKIVIKEEAISQIEKKIMEIVNGSNEEYDIKSVAEDIKNLKSKTFYSMFDSYSKLVDSLSVKFDKSIYPLKVIVDKELRVNDKMKPFIKSLIHVFRNSVDHGIETSDERIEMDKDEVGTISCTINKEKKNLHIIVADDGAGLDIDKIRDKVISLNIDINNFTNKDIEALIFNDQFSTKNEVSQISGRGVGMSAVKSEIEKLGGIIKINSQKNKGTTFEFVVPL
ncbi:ATP-binding protein [Sulfurospirillum arcachonense]|uniref:ATP-binding protein n=1 Tax=Sulfurospirillum arcachonense TaxID=57666 RepID=UPI000468882F|nr:ATP-binding protein [Sulfurospirillum arcachonense]